AGQAGAQQAGDAVLDRGRERPTVRAGPPRTSLPPPEVRIGPGELGKVAALGLGISLVATVVPGVGILRLHPRSLLTDTS
ncbi:ABC transporter permease, partial [Streptomyces triticagri]